MRTASYRCARPRRGGERRRLRQRGDVRRPRTTLGRRSPEDAPSDRCSTRLNASSVSGSVPAAPPNAPWRISCSKRLLGLEQHAEQRGVGEHFVESVDEFAVCSTVRPSPARAPPSHPGDTSGDDVGPAGAPGRGSGAGSKDDGGRCDLSAAGVDVDAPQRRDDSRRGVGRRDALQLPRPLEEVVAAEQEVPASACRIEHCDVFKVERWSRLGRRVDEQRQLVEERARRVALDQPAAERVLHQEVDDVARREELVADGEFARVARGRRLSRISRRSSPVLKNW